MKLRYWFEKGLLQINEFVPRGPPKEVEGIIASVEQYRLINDATIYLLELRAGGEIRRLGTYCDLSELTRGARVTAKYYPRHYLCKSHIDGKTKEEHSRIAYWNYAEKIDSSQLNQN